jgi:hypothetical protein
MDRPRKQHRKGRKASRRLANLEAISQIMAEDFVIFRDGPIILCSGCNHQITPIEYDTGECHCGVKIGD